MKEQQELSAEKKRKPAATKKTSPAPPKLKLLVTVVNRERAELYAALLQSFEINFQLTMAAQGTANTEMLRMLGLTESDKAVIFSVVREDRATAALRFLEEKISSVHSTLSEAGRPLFQKTSLPGVPTYKSNPLRPVGAMVADTPPLLLRTASTILELSLRKRI